MYLQPKDPEVHFSALDFANLDRTPLDRLGLVIATNVLHATDPQEPGMVSFAKQLRPGGHAGGPRMGRSPVSR